MKGGCPPYGAKLMFKLLLIGRKWGLSDEKLEVLGADSLSIMRFLGVSMADPIPDAPPFPGILPSWTRVRCGIGLTPSMTRWLATAIRRRMGRRWTPRSRWRGFNATREINTRRSSRTIRLPSGKQTPRQRSCGRTAWTHAGPSNVVRISKAARTTSVSMWGISSSETSRRPRRTSTTSTCWKTCSTQPNPTGSTAVYGM